VNRLIGLWWLAKVLYPEQFPEDFEAADTRFFHGFFHMTPTDQQVEGVLAGQG
jgi:iron complex transport system substrate-binding protein